MNKQRENIYALRREILEGKIRLDEDEVRRHARLPDVARRGHPRLARRDLRARKADFEQWDLDAPSPRALTELFGIELAARRRPEAGRHEAADQMVDGALRLWPSKRYEEKEKALPIDPSSTWGATRRRFPLAGATSRRTQTV